ncbi:hypothetical protein AcW1_001769 [Taiwanofungus camphoratus]|nr:hypothetical protein AcW1_001769 [Antrodia cinnamomea]KAI0945580.1 hypothetical protein AcW1_001769 [Antrodia cinnamomea]
MKVLLTGVTGVAGLAIYRAALADRTITHITVLTRRPIPSWAVLPADAAAKTEVVLHSDFLTYPPDLARRLAAHDACIWALGRSSVGMNEKEYTELTHGYVMAAIRAFNEGGVGEGRTEESPFRFVLISGEGTDTTGKSSQMWARVKGRAENDLTEFCNTAHNVKAHIYRAAYFFPSKKYPEDRKNQRSTSANVADCVMSPVLSTLTPSLVSPIDDLARFAVELAKGRWPDQVLFRNSEMRGLIKQL